MSVQKKQKPNYAFKAQVIEQGFCDIEKAISKVFYEAHIKRDRTKPIDEYEKIDELRTAETTQSFLLEYHEKEYIEATKINHAEYKKRKRLRDRIEEMVSENPCVFLTLTFSDETLQNTTYETRRRYVTRYCKEHGARYIANIDYGKENGREHYHVVLELPKVDLKKWTYGFPYAETVRNRRSKDGSSADSKRIAKYVAKLTNHALKITGKRQAIIYGGF